jgi:hypothetical protein
MSNHPTRSTTRRNQPTASPTLWQQLAPATQQQIAKVVADLIRRVHQAAREEESSHDR